MAKVQFKRYETDAEAQTSDIVDGQFIVTKEGTSYADYGTDRVAFGGTLDAQMSDSSINGVQNKVIKEYVDTEVSDGVQEAKDYADAWKGTILWTNQNPTSNFSAQTITLSSSDYDLATVLYASSSGEEEMSVTVRNGKSAYLNATQIASAGIRAMKRTMTFNGSSVTVSAAISKVNTTDEGTTNGRLIPLVIIGYKTGLFD